MNKATPITIGGRVFYLEDDGYDRLRGYLDSLRVYFADVEGQDEIMGDIESRIAEILGEIQGSSGQEAIPVTDVAALMDTIGRPDDLSEGVDLSSAKGGTRRRFFRDPEAGMLAGVCSGMSRYVNIDPNIIRAGFALASFLSGLGILIYVVLWVVIPAAQTSADRLTMRGEPITLGGLASLSSTDEIMRTRTGLERIIAIPFHLLRRILAAMSTALVLGLGVVGTTVRRVTGFVAVGGAILFLTMITLFLALALINLPANYLDPSLMDFFEQVPRRTIAITTSLAFLIPGVFVLAWGMHLLRRKYVMQPNTGMAMLAVWFLAVVISGALWVRTTMRWQAFERTYPAYQTEEISIEPPVLAMLNTEGVRARVRIIDGLSHLVTIEGRRKEIERIAYTLNGTSLQINAAPNNAPCVICDTDPVQITIATPTPDSIAIPDNIWVERDYAAERNRRQAAQDSVAAENTLRQARLDSLAVEERLNRDRIRELQDSLANLR